MKLQEKIKTDIKKALKAGNQAKLEILRFLNAQLYDKHVEKGKKELTDEEVLGVINGQLKKLEESLGFAKKGNREELIKKAEAEIKILKEYLPEQMSDEELEKEIDKIIEENPKVPHPGALIGIAVKKLSGKADNKRISGMVMRKVKK